MVSCARGTDAVRIFVDSSEWAMMYKELCTISDLVSQAMHRMSSITQLNVDRIVPPGLSAELTRQANLDANTFLSAPCLSKSRESTRLAAAQAISQVASHGCSSSAAAMARQDLSEMEGAWPQQPLQQQQQQQQQQEQQLHPSQQTTQQQPPVPLQQQPPQSMQRQPSAQQQAPPQQQAQSQPPSQSPQQPQQQRQKPVWPPPPKQQPQQQPQQQQQQPPQQPQPQQQQQPCRQMLQQRQQQLPVRQQQPSQPQQSQPQQQAQMQQRNESDVQRGVGSPMSAAKARSASGSGIPGAGPQMADGLSTVAEMGEEELFQKMWEQQGLVGDVSGGDVGQTAAAAAAAAAAASDTVTAEQDEHGAELRDVSRSFNSARLIPGVFVSAPVRGPLGPVPPGRVLGNMPTQDDPESMAGHTGCQGQPSSCCGAAPSSSSTDPAQTPSNGWPSLGSIGHYQGSCKPCLFLYKAGCAKGRKCMFCHIQHNMEDVKRVRPSKKSRLILQQMESDRAAAEGGLGLPRSKSAESL